MYEYKIKVTDYLDNQDLEKVLNEFGKERWDVFQTIGYQKKDVGKMLGKTHTVWKTQYTLYMKRIKA